MLWKAFLPIYFPPQSSSTSMPGYFLYLSAFGPFKLTSRRTFSQQDQDFRAKAKYEMSFYHISWNIVLLLTKKLLAIVKYKFYLIM